MASLEDIISAMDTDSGTASPCASHSNDDIKESLQKMKELPPLGPAFLVGLDGTPLPPQEKKLGLSNPAQMDMIDRLRDLNIQQFVALPQLVVVGDQSSGKSSVLEAVMEFPLPRDSGLCTRFATNITFHRSPTTSVSVSIIPGPSCPPLRADALRRYKKNLKSLDDETFIAVLEEVGSHHPPRSYSLTLFPGVSCNGRCWKRRGARRGDEDVLG